MTKRKRLFVFTLLSVLILAAAAYTSRGLFYKIDVYKSGKKQIIYSSAFHTGC
jgi:hypothetical protein